MCSCVWLYSGTIISWLGVVAYLYSVLFCRKFVNANFMKRIKSRRSIERLIHFIDRQGLVPIFILMCFPFTPNTLVNFVASSLILEANIIL